jgi:hypothetical protein
MAAAPRRADSRRQKGTAFEVEKRLARLSNRRKTVYELLLSGPAVTPGGRHPRLVDRRIQERRHPLSVIDRLREISQPAR